MTRLLKSHPILNIANSFLVDSLPFIYSILLSLSLVYQFNTNNTFTIDFTCSPLLFFFEMFVLCIILNYVYALVFNYNQPKELRAFKTYLFTLKLTSLCNVLFFVVIPILFIVYCAYNLGFIFVNDFSHNHFVYLSDGSGGESSGSGGQSNGQSTNNGGGNGSGGNNTPTPTPEQSNTAVAQPSQDYTVRVNGNLNSPRLLINNLVPIAQAFGFVTIVTASFGIGFRGNPSFTIGMFRSGVIATGMFVIYFSAINYAETGVDTNAILEATRLELGGSLERNRVPVIPRIEEGVSAQHHSFIQDSTQETREQTRNESQIRRMTGQDLYNLLLEVANIHAQNGNMESAPEYSTDEKHHQMSVIPTQFIDYFIKIFTAIIHTVLQSFHFFLETTTTGNTFYYSYVNIKATIYVVEVCTFYMLLCTIFGFIFVSTLFVLETVFDSLKNTRSEKYLDFLIKSSKVCIVVSIIVFFSFFCYLCQVLVGSSI